MSISSEQLEGKVWMIKAHGRLDQNSTPELEQTLNDLLEQGHYRFIVNFNEATYINSGGLRCLVSAWRRAQKQDGDIVLCGLNSRLEEIFSLVGFDRVFRIYSSCTEASRQIVDTSFME